MVNIIANKGVVDYGLKEFVLDSVEDLKSLNIIECSPGSVAFIIPTSQVYMKNGQGEWLEI